MAQVRAWWKFPSHVRILGGVLAAVNSSGDRDYNACSTEGPQQRAQTKGYFADPTLSFFAAYCSPCNFWKTVPLNPIDTGTVTDVFVVSLGKASASSAANEPALNLAEN